MNNEWLPIEQAPKDRAILVKTLAGHHFVVKWKMPDIYSINSNWCLSGSYNPNVSAYRVIGNITHYMELPE